jgi:hypothetical protein
MCTTSTTDGPSRLASSASCAATSRTWVTEPATAGTRSEAIVWTESTTTITGRRRAAVAVTDSTSGSASSRTPSSAQPSRRARSATWRVDSSALT